MTQAKCILTLLFFLLIMPLWSLDVDPPTDFVTYEVKQVYKPLSISKDKLMNAETIADLNKHYKSDWVKEYKSVTIVACIDGVKQKVTSKNAMLTIDQKELMSQADAGTDISISAVYLPDNNLKSNDIHEMGFEFMVNPEIDATFPGGATQLKAYIKENVEEKVEDLNLRQYQLAVVKFTVAKDGSINNVSIFASTEDDKTDRILLSAIEDMPNWQPAHYTDGTLITQEYALTVGDNTSCTSNLLNLEEN